MSNFLDNIVARNNNQLETVQPRIPSLFEPGIETRNLSILGDFEQDTAIDYPSIEENILESATEKINKVPEIHHLEIESSPEQQISYPHQPHTSPQKINQMTRESQRKADEEGKEYIFTRDKDELSTNFPVKPQTNFVTNNYFETVEIHNQKSSEPPVIQQLIAKETSTKEIFTPRESKTETPRIHPLIFQQPETKIVEQIVLPTKEKEMLNDIEKYPNPTPQEIPLNQSQTLIKPAQITPKISVIKESQPILEKAETTPTINVTIGRIEVRATTTATASKPAKPKQKPAVMSLEEYLRQRGGSK